MATIYKEMMSRKQQRFKIKIMSAITDSDTMIKDLLITVRDDKGWFYVKVLGKGNFLWMTSQESQNYLKE